MNEEQDVCLEEALTLVHEGARSRGTVSSDWAQGRTAFGGLVAGLMLRALEHNGPSDKPPRSLLISFVGPVTAAPFEIETRVLREGSNLHHRHAELRQAGHVCATMAGVFAAGRDTSVKIAGATAPPAKDPSQGMAFPYIPGITPRFLTHFESRWVSSNLPFTGGAQAHVAGYVRHTGQAPVDYAGVLALLDSWPPTVLPVLQRPAPASTVTWMVDFVSAPSPDEAWDAYHFYESEAQAASDGCATTQGRLWGADGRLIAASRQMIVEFS